MFVMANSKNVVFFMVKNRCVRYGCVRYDGTPARLVLKIDMFKIFSSKNQGLFLGNHRPMTIGFWPMVLVSTDG